MLVKKHDFIIIICTLFCGLGVLFINDPTVCLAIALIQTRPIAHILFAKDFYQAWVFVPFLLVSSMLNAASGYIGPILAAKKDSKSMAIAAFGGAGVNVVLNIALVYLMGIQGATIATVTPRRTYSEACQLCEYYPDSYKVHSGINKPCATGIMSLTMRADGLLSFCRMRNDSETNLKDKTLEEVKEMVKMQLAQFENCYHYEIGEKK